MSFPDGGLYRGVPLYIVMAAPTNLISCNLIIHRNKLACHLTSWQTLHDDSKVRITIYNRIIIVGIPNFPLSCSIISPGMD